MKNKSLWFGVGLLFAANGVMLASSADAEGRAEHTMTVRQCACVYGGDAGGPSGPGVAECLVFFQYGCDDVRDCENPCPEIE